jgi:hypothetical protein
MDSLSTPEQEEEEEEEESAGGALSTPGDEFLSASSTARSLTNTVFTGATQQTFQCTACRCCEVKDPVDFSIVMLPGGGNQSSPPVPLDQLLGCYISPGVLSDFK